MADRGFTVFHTEKSQQSLIRMSRFWSQIVHGLTPYTPGEQPKIANLIKLNTNECPYMPDCSRSR